MKRYFKMKQSLSTSIAVFLVLTLLVPGIALSAPVPAQAKTIEHEVLVHNFATQEDFDAVKDLYLPRIQNADSEGVKKLTYIPRFTAMQFQMQGWYNSSGCKLDITGAVEQIKQETADEKEPVYIGISAEINARNSEGGFGFLYDDEVKLPGVELASTYGLKTVECLLSEVTEKSYEKLYMGFFANDPSIFIRNVRVYYFIGERELPVPLVPSDSPAGANQLIFHDLGEHYPARSNFYSPYKQGALMNEEYNLCFGAESESATNGIRMNVTSFVAKGISGCTFGAAMRMKVESWTTAANRDNKALLFFEVVNAEGAVVDRVILGSYEPNDTLSNITNDVNDIGVDWSAGLLRGQSQLNFSETDTVYLCVNQKNQIQCYDEVCLWYYKDDELTATETSVSQPFYDEENEMLSFEVENLTKENKTLVFEVNQTDEDGKVVKQLRYKLLLEHGTDRTTISVPAQLEDQIRVYYLENNTEGRILLDNYTVSSQIWIGTWGSSQLTASGDTLPPEPGLENNTYRQAVRTSIGGDFLRIRFSNEFGKTPLVLESVHIAALVQSGLSQIDPATDVVVTFNGETSVTIPAGETLVSDVLSYSFEPLDIIAVTSKFGDVPSTLTSHTASRSTNWLLSGSHVTDEEMIGASTATSWYFLNDIEVLAPETASAVVCFGDSITDGYGSITDQFSRWSDKLAEALQANEATKDVAVINRGIGGNSIWGGNGPAGVKRFEKDVLDSAGVKYMIILIGVNDIGYANTDISGTMIAQMTAWAEQCHENGILVYAGTILPFKGNSYYTELHDEIRIKVNEWMLSEEAPFDAVIDFATAIADPSDLSKMQAVYANDFLHPSPAGYEFMGELIPVSLFE